MARFFHYKSPQALMDDVQRLGLGVELRADLEPLLRPIEVGGRRLGNRLAIQPMEGCDGDLDGRPGELTLRRYRRFGSGGAKLVWGEACAVVPEGRANPRQLVICKATAPAFRRLVEECRKAHRESMGSDADLLVGLQLTHSGRYSVPNPVLAHHDPLLDPLTFRDKSRGLRVGPTDPLISDADLDRLLDRYEEAAGLAWEVGFDFVDLKQCHRYLLNELLAAKTRPGKYGGSFENRTRFIRELVGRLRHRHPTALIATRLNVYDGPPFVLGPDGRGIRVWDEKLVCSCWGTAEQDPARPDLAEPIALVGQLRSLGVALVNVSMGNPYASPHLVRPFEYPPPDGYETPEHPLIGVDRHFRLTAQVQQAHPELAVVGSGYSWLQAYALEAGAANVAAGRVSIVGIGRGALAQPEFGRRASAGEPLDPKRLCRTFSYCTALMRSKHHPLGQFPTGCPPFDRDVYGPIWDEARRPPAGFAERKTESPPGNPQDDCAR
jgi:NADPH2 dehydrogenase